MEGSNFLTDSVRKFVATKEEKYLYDYWNEVNVLKKRDKVIEELLSMNIPPNEEKLVKLAKQYSDLLIESATDFACPPAPIKISFFIKNHLKSIF